MKIEVSEALGLHEMLQSLAMSIEKLAVYEEEAQNEEVRHLAREICRGAEQDYEELRDLVDGGGMGHMLENAEYGWHDGVRTRVMSRSGKSSPHPVQPHPTGRLSDRAIVTDLLECCKSFAVKATWIATEMAHQSIRRTLAEMSRKNLDDAFRIYKFMESEGWYPAFRAGQNPEQWLTETHRRPEDVSRFPSRSAVM